MTAAGVFGLFVSAFVSATLVPMSSEVVLAALIAARGFDAVLLVLVATAGNTLGALVNWLLGRFCLRWRDSKWFPVRADRLQKGIDWFRRYGIWSLLLAWLPIVGDPITFVAGVARVRLPLFLLLVALGKGARYAIVGSVSSSLFT
jgi:membrane protein YqaA with SNARE-associated domain